MKNKNYAIIKNSESIPLNLIPVLPYASFSNELVDLLSKDENHCVNYFAFSALSKDEGLQFIACIANDLQKDILVLSHHLKPFENQSLDSITPKIKALHIFEREIYENVGVYFNGHPWLKPVRFAHDRADKDIKVKDYPFYKIESQELHEVGVGPIHAGIIEPGHFRFICNGENVLHLEIQHGWQHRGVEQLMLDKDTLLKRVILAESIAGDTAVGHCLAFVQTIESLGAVQISEQLSVERAIALELERIAVHVADMGALCTDIAYSIGANIFGIMRTGIINFTQSWCGNRLGKGMVRVGGTNCAFDKVMKENLLKIFSGFEKQFTELTRSTYKLPSVENRFDDIGIISEQQARAIGAVGMVARMANIARDIRRSHPFSGFVQYEYEPIVLSKGDVFSRFLLRRREIKQSIAWIKNVLDREPFAQSTEKPLADISLKTHCLSVSLTEGWRGEICHCAITNAAGDLSYYKIKDPSMHNWKALELSLRDLEISDFPINNKSYDLSYCGFDL